MECHIYQPEFAVHTFLEKTFYCWHIKYRPLFSNALMGWFNFQANITINLLKPSSINPLISAYEGIFNSKYDFLAHPIAPPGVKVTVYEPSDKRISWEPHGISDLYLAPAINRYRSMLTCIPETRGFRISDQIDYFPTKFPFPGASTAEILISAIANLQLSLNKTHI
jgi:hypothetical protein